MLRPAYEAARNLAPSGMLRVALNFGNPGLVRADPVTREVSGVSVDLSRGLARELELDIEFVHFDSARYVIAALDQDRWDVAFLAINPARLEQLQFTQPYATMAAAYMVREDSPLHSMEAVDQTGIRVASTHGAAYDLYLSAHLRHAGLVRAQTSAGAVELFVDEHLDVAAGIRPYLASWAAEHPGYRLLDGRFTTIEHAMATPKGRTLGWAHLASYIERMRACNFVAQSLARSQLGDMLAPV